MKGRKARFIFLVFLCLPTIAGAVDISQIKITDKTNPEIAELYQQYVDAETAVNKIQSERKDKLNENYQAMYDKQQSKENRTLDALTTAATGIGAMELAEGLAEQNADKDADAAMNAYIATMRCKYGNGKSVKAGTQEIELPGGNDSQIMKLRAEYIALAADLKERKNALGIKPGIESEEILDKAEMGLYDDENIGVTDGAYASRYRAKMMDSKKDQEQLAADAETAKNRVVGGAVATGAGVVGGIVGNAIINKDAPKEQSKQINAEYDQQLNDATATRDGLGEQLNAAIEKNANAVRQYNDNVAQHQNLVANINKANESCRGLFDDYVNVVTEFQPIENETDTVPNTDFPDFNENKNLLNACNTCEIKGGIFDPETGECPCPNDRPVERNGKCDEIQIDFDDSLLETDDYIDIDEIPDEVRDHEMFDDSLLETNDYIDMDEMPDVAQQYYVEQITEDVISDDDYELEDLEDIESDDTEILQYECGKIADAKWDAENAECVCEKPDYIVKGTECVDAKTISEDDNREPGEEYCPGPDEKGKNPNRLKSITDQTKIGDFCSSGKIASGEVVWYNKAKTICTCRAHNCRSDKYELKNGSCQDIIPRCETKEYTGTHDAKKWPKSKYVPIKDRNAALDFCKEQSNGKCTMDHAINNYQREKGRIICNPPMAEYDTAVAKEAQDKADSKLKYYHCCEAAKVPKGIDCKCVDKFSSYNVTPIEADGLMKELARKSYGDKDIKCLDQKSFHGHHDNKIKVLQCASRTNEKRHYEFAFKSLDNGNRGFYGALCSMWGLKSGSHSCKNATEAQCKEIATVMNRTFIPGATAKITNTGITIGFAKQHNLTKSTECIINEHPSAQSGTVAALNKTITKEDLRTINGINPLYFYDANHQVSANSDVYSVIEHYLFVDKKLPIKPFRCGATFVDNTNYFNGSRASLNEQNDKYNKCIKDSTAFSGGGERGQMSGGVAISCQKQYPLNLKTGDLLTCEYGDQKIDFLFRKLDAIWDRKTSGGYQAMLCLNEGGSFTGKSCAVANEQKCKDFNARFLKEYPDSKGMVWNGQTCVLKDTRYVARVRKVAQVTGMVTLTLVTAVAGGPIEWGLSVVEGGALVAEAVAEAKLSDWAEEFLIAASKCKKDDSKCANAALKKHIARIDKGSKYFSDSQNHQIARQIERLTGMLDADTLTSIIDRGNSDGYIGEDRDPELEKALMAYYGTELSQADKNLITVKKIATIATFATLAGQVATAGLRVAVKKNWLMVSDARAAKWVDWKILKFEDVSPKVQALTKQGKKLAATTTNATVDAATGTGSSKTLKEEFADINVKENNVYRDATTGKFISEEEVLQRIDDMPSDEFARIGVKEEKTANGASRYRDIQTGQFISEDEVLRRIDEMPSDDLAAIGVRESSSYRDTTTGKFISEDEVLNRIDDMPSNVADDATDAANGAKKADTPAPVEPKPKTAEPAPKNTTEPAPKNADTPAPVNNNANSALSPHVSRYIDGVKNGEREFLTVGPGWLSPDEVDAALKYARENGLVVRELDDYPGLYNITKSVPDNGVNTVSKTTTTTKRTTQAATQNSTRTKAPVSTTTKRTNNVTKNTATSAVTNTNKSSTAIIDDLYAKTDEVWEYVPASDSDLGYGVYRLKSRWVSMREDRMLDLEKNLKSANLDATIDKNGYMIIREENIATDAKKVTTTPKSTANTAPKTAPTTTTKRANNVAKNEPKPTPQKANNVTNVTQSGDSITRWGKVSISSSDEQVLQKAVAKKQAGTLTEAEHRTAMNVLKKYYKEDEAIKFAEDMRNNIIKEFYDNPDKMLEFLDAGEDQARLFAQFVIDKIGPKYGIPSGTIKVEVLPFKKSENFAYAQWKRYDDYGREIRSFQINSTNESTQRVSQEQLIYLISHEFTHAIDDMAPQFGVIGEKINKYGSYLYKNSGWLYDNNPVEMVAHKVGDVVSGTTNYGFNIDRKKSIITEIVSTLENKTPTSTAKYSAPTIKNTTKGPGAIINESQNMTLAQQQKLLESLSDEQKLEVAKLKVSSGEVTLPFGSTVDDLAKNPDLLNISGRYVPLNPEALKKASEIKQLEKTGQSTDEAVKELRHILSNDISVDTIIANGTQYKEKLLGIIASDPQLTKQAQNFSKLSKTQKESFMNKIVQELDKTFTDANAVEEAEKVNTKLKVKYIDSWTEIGKSKDLDTRQLGAATTDKIDGGNIIYILNNSSAKMGYGNELDDTMALFAHEYGHVMDRNYAERVAVGGNSAGRNLNKKPDTSTWEGMVEYLIDPTESSSRGINEIVGPNFTKDLNATLNSASGKVVTSPLTKLQKLKIQSGYTGNTFVFSAKETNNLGIDYYKLESNVDRSGSLQSVVDIMKERGVENVFVIKEDGKEIIAVFDSTEDAQRALKAQDATNTVKKTTVAPTTTTKRANNTAKNTTSNTTKQSSPLYELEDMYEQKLSDDVLVLQQSQGMEQKVKAYDDMFNKAKQTLSPEEYEHFEILAGLERQRIDLELNIAEKEKNLTTAIRDKQTVEMYLQDDRQLLAQTEQLMNGLKKSHPQAGKVFDANVSTIDDAKSVIFKSDDLAMQKKVDMITELNKTIDQKALKASIQNFKDNIIAGFPKSLYDRAKNWQNMSLDQRKVLLEETQTYLQKVQGCSGVQCEVKFESVAEIGGGASYGDGVLKISDNGVLKESNFNEVFRTMVHENIHLGQEAGVRLNEDLVKLSQKNYVPAVFDIKANQMNPLEVEAYTTENMFGNILDEIARYHNW